ncbi:DUF2726 domain-containing protein [Aurantiacibacter arachoides]|uniref:DUF2726 domain-containing protein n=1 Tax=Aurantiacibacter arachoides TaxID=1850444 RepID=UPI001F2AF23D|nr:DUF2726 domain-containing protein [Aurantiacibacter arachoides]
MNFLLDRPLALLIVLAIGAAIGIALERFIERGEREKRQAYWRGRNAGKRGGATVSPLRKDGSRVSINGTPDGAKLDAAEQLRRVMEADFKPRPLLNRPEAAVFAALDQAVIARNPNWQVMAQVSLGEFLASPEKDAFGAINAKRVDFALMDERASVRHAIEYQGTGHHQGSAAARDAVKKEALRKAGIGYHEVVAGHTTPAELRRLVERLVPAA